MKFYKKNCINQLFYAKINKEGKIMNCFMCKGNLEEKKVNYVVDLEDTIIIIKGVPAKVCTQCGEQYFDEIGRAHV